MIYIRKVRVDECGRQSVHISHVQYSFSPSGKMRVATSKQIAHNIDAGLAYRSHHDDTSEQSEIITTNSGGHRVIVAVTDDANSNALLALPRF